MRRAPPSATARRERLLEEQAFVEASLDDLERERSEGAIAAEDYARLRSRYESEAREIDADLAAGARDGEARSVAASSGRSGPPGRRAARAARRHRKGLVIGAASSFGAAAIVLGLGLGGVAPFGTRRPPGLSLQARIQTELAEAAVFAEQHNVMQAVSLYDKVLAMDPHQPEALAEGGWLVRLAGISTHRASLVRGGDGEIAAAVRFAPRDAVPRAYYGVALLEDRRSPKAASRQFDAMLADRPSRTLVTSVRSEAVRAYEGAGLQVPGAFEGA